MNLEQSELSLFCFRFWRIWYEFKRDFTAEIIHPQILSLNESLEEPNAVDWRDRGAVTEVKDQGKCGSSYAFSAIGTLESHHFIKTGKLLNLSEQEIVDCSGLTYGCKGGKIDLTYNHLIKNGISSSSDYPYKSKQGKCLHDEVPQSRVKLFGFAAVDGKTN